MIRPLLILLFTFYSILLSAQLSVSSTYATAQGKTSEEISPNIILKNISSRTLELKWERIKNQLPSGWESAVCDKQCYSGYLDSKTFSLAPGESISDFRVNFRPNGNDGIGSAEIKIFELKQPQNQYTITFSASANPSVSSNSISNSIPSVYPNPVTEFLSVSDPSNDVKYVEIYNLVGKKIYEFALRNDNAKIDVSELQRGIYIVRLLDKNRHLLRTQKVSKYNP